jgi:tetratricopeptide (TPR) repeat protein
MNKGADVSWVASFGSPAEPIVVVIGPAAEVVFSDPAALFGLVQALGVGSPRLRIVRESPSWVLLTTPGEPEGTVRHHEKLAALIAEDAAANPLRAPREDRFVDRPARLCPPPELMALPGEYMDLRFPRGAPPRAVDHARALVRIGWPGRAAALLRPLAAEDRDGEASYYLGDVLLNHLHDHDAAVAPLEQAVQMAPHQPEALHALGLAYAFTGRTRQAVVVQRRAADAVDTFECWANLATAALDVDPQQSYEAATRAIARDPAERHAHLIAAAAAGELGQHDVAARHLRDAEKAPRSGIPEQIASSLVARARGEAERRG